MTDHRRERSTIPTEVLTVNGCTVRITYAEESMGMDALQQMSRDSLQQPARRKN